MTDAKMKNGKFTQLPNSLITANISDALFRLLAYSYSNRNTFRYNVPHCVDVLRASRRHVQRLFSVLKDEGVYVLTTSREVKYGSIPNYLFNAQAVPAFLERAQAATEMTAPADEVAPKVAPEPATEVATEATPKAATKSSTNNTNKQDQQTRPTNKIKKQYQEPSSRVASQSSDEGGMVSSGRFQAKWDSVSSFNKMFEEFRRKAERSEAGSLVSSKPAEGTGPVRPVDTVSVVPPMADTSSVPKALSTAGVQGSAPAAAVTEQTQAAADSLAPEADSISTALQNAPRFGDRRELTIRRIRESWAESPDFSEAKVARMELELRKLTQQHISKFGEPTPSDGIGIRHYVEKLARNWPD